MATSSETLIAGLCSPDENTRRYAAEDLGDSDDAGAVGPLVGALSDSSPAVREAAMDSLTRIGGEPVVHAVLPALGSENVPLRNAACFLLGELGEIAVGPLAKLLDDQDKDVRLLAIDTLARIGSGSAETTLVRALEDADVNVAAAAAGALGRIGTASSVEPLIAALKADSWVRCAAAKSLGRIGGLEALRTLTGLACDEDPLVSFAAAQALIKVGARRNTLLVTEEEK